MSLSILFICRNVERGTFMVIKIGENIKKFREIYKLRQDDLGARIGVGGATISSWEKGRTEPNMGYTQALADIFSISTDELIYGNSDHLTEIPMDNIVFDDYFPLHYCSNLSAGSFEELLDAEPDSVVYVPIAFQNKKKRLHAFKINGTSMNNVIPDGSIVVCEDNLDNAIKYKDGSIVVAFMNGEATVKRLYRYDSKITLMPDSTDKTYQPIFINENQQLYIVGKVIWHMNPEDVAEKCY